MGRQTGVWLGHVCATTARECCLYFNVFQRQSVLHCLTHTLLTYPTLHSDCFHANHVLLHTAIYAHVHGAAYAGMVSDDMLREQGRRNWEEEAQRRYELEQLAEADREQRVEVLLIRCHLLCFCAPSFCISSS